MIVIGTFTGDGSFGSGSGGIVAFASGDEHGRGFVVGEIHGLE